MLTYHVAVMLKERVGQQSGGSRRGCCVGSTQRWILRVTPGASGFVGTVSGLDRNAVRIGSEQVSGFGRNSQSTPERLSSVELVVANDQASRARWWRLVAAHHYLGYTPFAGAQLRYLVTWGTEVIGALGFAASA
nr:DUF4338 domain-containing protein [Actinomycetota bacterium]